MALARFPTGRITSGLLASRVSDKAVQYAGSRGLRTGDRVIGIYRLDHHYCLVPLAPDRVGVAVNRGIYLGRVGRGGTIRGRFGEHWRQQEEKLPRVCNVQHG